MVLSFGKYKDYDLREVPDEYLNWLIDSTSKNLDSYQSERERRDQEELASQSLAQRIIESGFRTLSKQLHPDQGGTDADMRELIATREMLRGRL